MFTRADVSQLTTAVRFKYLESKVGFRGAGKSLSVFLSVSYLFYLSSIIHLVFCQNYIKSCTLAFLHFINIPFMTSELCKVTLTVWLTDVSSF